MMKNNHPFSYNEVMSNIEKIIAEKVKKIGGETYYVGGCVRDEFLNIPCLDKDIEVHGISKQQLYSILKEVGEPLEYGKSFGIYSLKGQNLDIAMPRSEKKIGDKHTSFEVTIDPFIGKEKAAKRRDFTINALMKNVLTNEIVDYYNGISDLKNKKIRHVDDDSFAEDPLRVFRGAQFAARFNFEIEEKTMELCKTIDTTTLSKERVIEELKKALLKADKPSIFFDSLKKMNQMDYWFAELKDVDLTVLDKAAAHRNEVGNPYFFMLTALTYDMRLRDANTFLKRLYGNSDIHNYISKMWTTFHASEDGKLNDAFYSTSDQKGLIAFIKILRDKDVSKEYEAYLKLMEKDYVKGKDLIDLGYKPDEKFKIALDYATSLRLQGIDKKEALEKTIEFIKKV